MGRGRDSRVPSKRGFGDDFGRQDDFRPATPSYDRPRGPGGPPSRAPSTGPEVDATVKWYNPEKGFGFVELGDGSGDAFVHVRAVEAAGHTALEPGTKLSVRVGQGQKGAQVTEISSVDTSTAQPSAPRGDSFRGPPRAGGGGFRPAAPARPRYEASGPTEERVGQVKWYNPEKGFGFVAMEDGGKDVFLHRSVLSQAGLSDIDDGQRVRMSVVQGQKGPEASSVELLG